MLTVKDYSIAMGKYIDVCLQQEQSKDYYGQVETKGLQVLPLGRPSGYWPSLGNFPGKRTASVLGCHLITSWNKVLA